MVNGKAGDAVSWQCFCRACFSVSKEILIANLKENFFVVLFWTYDAIKSKGGETSEMMQYAKLIKYQKKKKEGDRKIEDPVTLWKKQISRLKKLLQK